MPHRRRSHTDAELLGISTVDLNNYCRAHSITDPEKTEIKRRRRALLNRFAWKQKP